MSKLNSIRGCGGALNSLLLRSRPLLPYRLTTRVPARRPGPQAKGIASGPRSGRTAAQLPQQESSVRQISLPGSRKGINAAREAADYWATKWKESSGHDTPLPNNPIIYHIDFDPRSDITQICPNGIVFAHHHPLGLKLWRIANPVPWSARSRTVRWSVYGAVLYYGGLFVLWAYNHENEPITGRWRFNWVSPSKFAKLQQQERSEIDKGINAFTSHLFPENHPWTQTLNSVLARLTTAAGLDDIEWQLHLVNAPGNPPLKHCVV